MRGVIGLASLIILAAATVLGVSWLVSVRAAPVLPSPETPEVRLHAVRTAFGDLHEARVVRAPEFDDFLRAYLAQVNSTWSDFESIVDLDRLLARVRELELDTLQRDTLRTVVNDSWLLRAPAGALPSVREIEWGPNGKSAVVAVRFIDRRESLRLRFFLVNTDRWRLYDVEDCVGDLRLSDLLAPLVDRWADGESPDRTARAGALRAYSASLRGDWDAAWQWYWESDARIPDDPRIGRMARTVLAALLVTDEPRKAIDMIESLDARAPIAVNLLADAQNDVGRHEEALRSIDEYESRVGGDSRADAARIRALRGLDDSDEALDYCRELPRPILAPMVLAEFAILMTGREMTAQDRAMLTEPDILVETLARLRDLGESAAMEQLLALHLETFPDEWMVVAAVAQAEWNRGDYQAVVDRLGPAVEQIQAQECPPCFDLYADAMLELEQVDELFARCAGCFEAVMEWVLEREDATRAHRFLDERTRDRAPWPYERAFRARAFELEDRHGDAAEQYRRAIDESVYSGGIPDVVAESREGWYRSMVEAGRGAEAYELADDRDEAFGTLAWFMLEDDRGAEMLALVEQRIDEGGEDAVLPYLLAQATFAVGAFERALRVLRENEAHLTRRDTIAFDLLHIRTLIELGRWDEALAEAKEYDRGADDPRFFVAIAVRRGDVTGAIEAVRAAFAQRPDLYELADYYEDVKLGPLLRSPAFAEFRAVYPPDD